MVRGTFTSFVEPSRLVATMNSTRAKKLKKYLIGQNQVFLYAHAKVWWDRLSHQARTKAVERMNSGMAVAMDTVLHGAPPPKSSRPGWRERLLANPIK